MTAMDGFHVDPEELARLAEAFDQAAVALLSHGLHAAEVGLDPVVLTTGLLAPVELAVLVTAVDRAAGAIVALAGRLVTDAGTLAVTRRRYELVDSSLARDVEAVLQGRYRKALLLTEAVLTSVVAPHLDRPAAAVLSMLGRERMARLLADGPGGAVEVAVPARPSGAGSEPVRDLAGSLQGIAELPDRSGAGREDVIALTQLSGEPPRYRLELPGLSSVLPTANPMTLPGSVAAELSRSSAYSRGVQRALDLAGVPKGAQVFLVGHSEGGIAAVNLAADPAFNGRRCAVTHVVTAGAPVDGKPRPAADTTSVLSLQNVHDLVPGLDGVPPPGRHGDRELTYTFSRDTGSVVANHSAELYAEQVRHVLTGSPNPDARAFLDGVAPYFGEPAGATRYFALTERR